MEKQGKDSRKELLQILFDIILIGVFSIIKSVLMFYYSGIVYVIFGVLELLVCCVLVVNVYRLFFEQGKKNDDQQDSRQIQALLYKQMKKLEAKMPENASGVMRDALVEQKEGFEQRTEELRMNQLRSAKAILAKIEEEAEKMHSQEENAGEQGILDKLQELEQQMAQMAQLQNALMEKLDGVTAAQVVSAEGTAGEAQTTVEETPTEEPAAAEEIAEEESVHSETPAPIEVAMDGDPNKELSPEEIAALFAGVN